MLCLSTLKRGLLGGDHALARESLGVHLHKRFVLTEHARRHIYQPRQFGLICKIQVPVCYFFWTTQQDLQNLGRIELTKQVFYFVLYCASPTIASHFLMLIYISAGTRNILVSSSRPCARHINFIERTPRSLVFKRSCQGISNDCGLKLAYC